MTLFRRHSNDIRPLGPTKAAALPAPHQEQQHEQQRRSTGQPSSPQRARTRPSQGQLVEGVLAGWRERPGWHPHPLIDVGLNLTDQSFDKDRAEVLSRAARTGVVAAVLTGTCVRTSSAAARLAAAAASAAAPGAPGGGSDAAGALGSPQLYFTAGVHPHNAKGCGPGTLDALAALAADPRCVALGEMGLDFNRNFSPQDVQEEWFVRQVQLAERLQLPLFMHCRDAYPRFTELLRQHRRSVPGVVHCFTSPRRDELEALLAEEGLLVGITGWVCDDRPARGGAELAALLPLIPDDRLLLETDAPYLTPRTITPAKARPQRNEPALLPAVLEAVAAARGQDLAHVAAVATANARRLFCLS